MRHLGDEIPDWEAFALVGWALAPIAPAATLRARILQALDGRFDGVLERLARFFDLGIEAARRLLDSLDTTAPWKAGPIPGLEVLTVEAGPARAQAYTGLLRMAPGLRFPAHRHLGAEETLVLDGGIRQDDGLDVEAGTLLRKQPGSAHAFVVDEAGECIAALVLHGGIDFETYTASR